MALVPATTFTMGADEGGEKDEHPAHQVTLEAFYLDLTEVTNAAYDRCVDAKACRPPKRGPWSAGPDQRFRGAEQPVVGVSWDDAKAYCDFAGKRLPREAEWELAARGTDDRRFPWGNEKPDPSKHGCFGRRLGARDGITVKVGSYPEGAGPYGHLDMAGNVWEWMADSYDPYAYRRPTAAQGIPGSCDDILATQNELRRTHKQGFTGTNPIPDVCERVLRGGAFNYFPAGLRVTNRVHHPGTWRLVMAGLRCAADVSAASSASP